MAAPARRAGALLLCLLAGSCGGDRTGPTPTTVPAPTTTAARVPKLTADPIPDLDATVVHGSLEALGFTKSTTPSAPGLVTTTSRRENATVSTYGKDRADVVKVVAEADKDGAESVLVAVARSVAKGNDVGRVETWLKAELTKGALRNGQPRTSRAAYARQPYDLIVTQTTATLSIGRLTG